MSEPTTLRREDCMTMADLCQLLSKSRRAVYEQYRTGDIPRPVSHPWGKRLLWDKAEIQRWAATKYPRIFSVNGNGQDAQGTACDSLAGADLGGRGRGGNPPSPVAGDCPASAG